ncbi:TFIIB-type zinc ribbon-containing protein [Oxalicibacterium solurbis]|nr:zf-TFIIB domain-containing protein [Oxalicibacterium solurbis]
MKCPVCSEMHLIMSDRHGIEIDYCPQCRGVWLDRGELDKLIERSVAALPPEPPPPPRAQAPLHRDDRHRQDARYGYSKDGYDKDGYGQKRKKNLLADLFDF